MENLKITIHFKTPFKLDRLTTIDSIILANYYSYAEKAGDIIAFDKEHKTVDFIEKKNGVFSGSIWFLEKDSEIVLNFDTKIKRVEHDKLYKNTKSKVASLPQYKNAMLVEETVYASSIYFYIKGDKEFIEEILQTQLKHVGKDRKLGYGEVSKIIVENSEFEKGFMLDECTPSKPLPVIDFKVKSKKIAFFRRVAPYWLNEDLERCYMPSMFLQETKDNSDTKEFIASSIDYISNVNFIYEKAKDEKCVKFKSCSFNNDFNIDIGEDKDNFSVVDNNTTYKCAISNEIENVGVLGDNGKFLKSWKSSFADFNYIKNNDFISYKSLWAISNLAKISYSIINNESWYYTQGKNSEVGKRFSNLVRDFKSIKPPFSINLKDTKNPQHVSFKGKVSISNAFFFVQYGNRTLLVDTQAINKAIEELDILLKENKELKKGHFLGNFLDKYHISGGKVEKSREIIDEFQKKHDSNTRQILSIVAY